MYINFYPGKPTLGYDPDYPLANDLSDFFLEFHIGRLSSIPAAGIRDALEDGETLADICSETDIPMHEVQAIAEELHELLS